MKDTKETLIYILKRLGLMVLTFVIIFVLCFCLVRLLPVSATPAPGQDKEMFYMSQVAMGRMYKGADGEYYDLPILSQLGVFIKNLFVPGTYTTSTGEVLTVSPFGYSYEIDYLATPFEVMIDRLPPTVLINIYSSLLSVPIGLGIGIYMALKKNQWQDHLLSILIMLFISVPSFVYAFLIQYLLGFHGPFEPEVIKLPTFEGNWGWFDPQVTFSMILPVLAMSFGSIAAYARYTRAELTEVLTSDFMLLARTKGLTRQEATVRHALRNSMVPIFPMLLGQIISVLSGSLVIEKIFNIPGVGGVFLLSITSRDLDVFQFVSMFYVLIGLVGGLVVDVSYGIVDPRIRMGGEK